MFIRKDRKAVIFTKKVMFEPDKDFVTEMSTSPKNQSYNFNLLSMPGLKPSYHGRKQPLDRDKSFTFPYVYQGRQ